MDELIKNLPVAAAMIYIVMLFLNAENKRAQQHIENAKIVEQQRKEHDLQISNMWATSFKQLVEQVNIGQQAIANALSEHEQASRERYERMGITDDLLKLAKEKLRK